MPLKVNDIIVYEPTPEWEEAQEMYGAVAVVSAIDDTYKDEETVVVRWVSKVDGVRNETWIVTAANCRKIGEVTGV